MDSSAGGSDDGGQAGSGGRGGQAGTGGAAGSPDGGGGETAGPGKAAIIIVSQSEQNFPAPIGKIIGGAAAATFGVRAGTDPCQSTTMGACQLFACAPMSGTNPQMPPNLLNAGSVTITGLAINIPLMYSAPPGAYVSASYMGYLWTSSRPATVTVTGSADVPAFTLNVTAPNPISVTSPAASNSTYTISRGSALAVTWTGGVEGMVTVSVSSGTAATGQVMISCSVDAATGTVTVPAAFMAKLGATGSFSAGVTNIAHKTISDWLMHFQAETMKDLGTATFTN
jgi:hypothetical protein